MGRYKKKRFKYTHKEAQHAHAVKRMMQRYPWVAVEEYAGVRDGVVRLIREGGAEKMWIGSSRGSKGRLTAYCATFEERRYFVGYDHETGSVTTWFPRTDPRVQAWILERYGPDEVRALFNDNGYREDLIG
jgi:hypothetical protein